MRTFNVPGAPVPQGNMRAFAVQGKAFTTSSNAGPLGRYRNDIRACFGEPQPIDKDVPVEVFIIFSFQRPKGHYNAKGALKDSAYTNPAPKYVTKKPDIDKVIRAVLDALTGWAYRDDSQVIKVNSVMVYADDSNTRISISEVPS